MKDYRTHLETLRQQAAEAALISALTTVQHKRELFAKHAEHLDALADEVERAMAATNDGSCYAFE
jgi:primosomal protein N''